MYERTKNESLNAMEKKKEKKRKFTYSKNGIMTSEYSVFVLLWCFFKTKI